MESTAASHDRKISRLAAALKRNMARRKAVSHDITPIASLAQAPHDVFVDDDDDTTSPTGCCGGCR